KLVFVVPAHGGVSLVALVKAMVEADHRGSHLVLAESRGDIVAVAAAGAVIGIVRQRNEFQDVQRNGVQAGHGNYIQARYGRRLTGWIVQRIGWIGRSLELITVVSASGKSGWIVNFDRELAAHAGGVDCRAE